MVGFNSMIGGTSRRKSSKRSSAPARGADDILQDPNAAALGRNRSSAASLARRVLLALGVLYISAAVVVRGALASAITAPIEQLYTVLPQVMKAGKGTPFRQRYDALTPVIDQVFDLEAILKISVGPQWPALSPEQQASLRQAFRRYTIATYVSNFDGFSGQRFEIQPGSMAAGADEIVQTRIVPASGEPHRLDYVMRQMGGAWKVVDVLADGSISRVAVQRSEIRAVLARGGAPALLDRLRKKTAEMSGGQVP